MLILLISAVFLLILLVTGVMIYNNLVKKKNMMKESWSGINVYLKKRYELVPNLVETVKAYMNHEKQLLESVAQQRAAAFQSADMEKRIIAETGLTASLGKLMGLVENYPVLKADTNFLQLSKQLENIETEIEMSRRYYNGTVRENNILIESFPSNLLATMFKFKTGSFFELQDTHER